jgi:hypothetical protein
MAMTNTPNLTAESKADPRVLHPLHQLRGLIRRYVTLEGVAIVALFLAIWFWVGLLLDYGVFKLFTFDWVQEAPRAVRLYTLVVIVAALLALVITRIVLRLAREFSAPSLALVLERRFPQLLGDRLITAVELADVEKQAEYGYSPELIRKTIDDARERVGQVPVSQAFNWGRLRRQGYRFAALTLGVLLLVGIGVCAIWAVKPRQFTGGFSDVASIWVERNVLLRNTAWPRQAYLELLDFPGDEVRIGRDQPPPRLRVQAYRWVWADKDAPEGWRPLAWADLPKALPGVDVPPLPIEELRRADHEARINAQVANWVSALPYAPATEDVGQGGFNLPSDVADLPDDLARWKVDRVETLLKENKAVRGFLDSTLGAERLLAFEGVFEKLAERAADPGMSRTLRMLKVPDEVRLSYRGVKTSVDMSLRQESGNEYTGTLTDLKESVNFRVRGEDYVTPSKRIVLVPAPTVVDLRRTEYRPAYLYHRPVLDEEMQPIPANPAKLKGLKQVFPDMGISLTGDRSRFEIPTGTDVELSATVDKDLERATIIGKPGKYPGLDVDAEPLRLDLQVESDRRTVKAVFGAGRGNPIARLTEFDLEFRDTDGVTSKRLIQIQPKDDPPPEVEVTVVTIRKVGANFMCTPRALIPFAKESRITDRDGGINKIQYQFTYTQLESVTDLSAKASLVGLFFHNTPAVPSVAPAFYRAGMLSAFANTLKSGSHPTVEQSVPLESFVEEYRRGGFLTLQNTLPLLQQKLSDDAKNLIIQKFDFGSAGELGFDIARVLPGLAVKDPQTTPQPQYLITLTVAATDSNVETGPKVGTNKEPLVFKIVSEPELLAEISREESDLGAKLDEVLRRLRDSEAKLSGIANRLPSLSIPGISRDDFVPEQTRSTEIMESVTKAKDLTQEVATDYARILAEYKTNRFTSNLTTRLETKIVTPLDEVLKQEYPRWEGAHATFHAALNQATVPPQEVVGVARQRMSELLNRMQAIRTEIGEILGIQKLIKDAQEILKSLTLQIAPGIKFLIQRESEDLIAPDLRVPPLVTLAAGQKATVNVEVNWKFPLEEPYSLQVVVPQDSGLKAPARIDVKEAQTKVSFDITAGSKSGEFDARLVPSYGKPVPLKIFVK